MLFGVAGLMMARAYAAARSFPNGGVVVHLVLRLHKRVVDRRSQANFVPVNDADDWLHSVLRIGMVGRGMILSRKQPARTLEAR